ncbi:MAG TPA: SDR family oxidoreductase [Smithellaceae bacterium]|nr:SDR family oxidoreductase [Smithellaceae bacterium]
MKKVLVTGAGGFIGSHVVEELLKENVEVRALIRPGESLSNLKGMDIEIFEGDVLDNGAVLKAMAGIDTVFHLAAIYSIWMKDWSRIYEVNIQGTQNVLWAAIKSNIARVVYTSSIGSIGIAPGKQLSDEKTSFNQHTLGNHYILTKYLSQQIARGFAANGLDVVIVNPCFPFGTNDIVPTPTGQLIVNVLKSKNIVAFPGGINIVDVRDVAKGHVLAARKGKPGELYILGNRNVTMKEFMQLVYKAAGFTVRPILTLPVPMLKISAYFFKYWADNISNKMPLSTPPEVSYASQYLFFDNTKARNELGLTLTPIDESLYDSVRWFRENRYAP